MVTHISILISFTWI